MKEFEASITIPMWLYNELFHAKIQRDLIVEAAQEKQYIFSEMVRLITGLGENTEAEQTD